MSASPDATPPPRGKCRIAEIVQYTCKLEKNAQGIRGVHCYPIPRIFRICPGRPAVEITKFVNVDINTGAVEIPPESSQSLPRAKPWRDVRTYDQDHSPDADAVTS